MSPFSRETEAIRVKDIALFAAVVNESKVKLPPNIKRHSRPSCGTRRIKRRTTVALEKTLKLMVLSLRLAGLRLFRPVHRLSAELVAAVMARKNGLIAKIWDAKLNSTS